MFIRTIFHSWASDTRKIFRTNKCRKGVSFRADNHRGSDELSSEGHIYLCVRNSAPVSFVLNPTRALTAPENSLAPVPARPGRGASVHPGLSFFGEVKMMRPEDHCHQAAYISALLAENPTLQQTERAFCTLIIGMHMAAATGMLYGEARRGGSYRIVHQ